MANNTCINRKIQPKHSNIKLDNFPVVNSSMLQNGIELFTMDISNTEMVRIDFMFKGGAWVQDKPLQAMTSLMMIKEGADDLSPQQINQLVDFYGAKIFIKKARTYNTLSVMCLKKFIKQVCNIIYKILSKPYFDENSLIITRQQLFTNYNIKMAKVAEVAERELFNQILGKCHPATSYESEEDFTNLSRQLIANYYNKFINSNNCKMVLSGNIDQHVMDVICHFFANDFWGGQNPVEDVEGMIRRRDMEPVGMKKDRVECKMPDKSMQTAVAAANIIPRLAGKQLAELLITNTIVGGYFGSRLMDNIREKKGYTYGITSSIRNFVTNAAIYIQTETSDKYLEHVIEEIDKELELIARIPPSIDELNRVKNYFVGKSIRTYEANLQFPEHLINNMALGLSMKDIKETQDEIQRIKPEDISICAQRFFSPQSFTYAIARG